MCRILHLGLGRFHRAHQAVYFSRLGPEWTISAWSMRSPVEADAFPGVYQVVVPGQPPESIAAIVETGFPARDRDQWERAWTAPELQVVTLTVTEKGYAEPLFQQITEALTLRRKCNLPDPVFLSCDNLRSNGQKLSQGLQNQVRCPNSVVDRIVPAGHDPRTILTEPFSQWVIEGGWNHPPLERVGVQFVKDILPYEEMKLGLLNLPHSYLAYAGLPAGHTYVHEAMSELGAQVELLQRQAARHLSLPAQEISNYAARVRRRFQNPDLPHALAQIAMDGSQKLPQRLSPLLQKDGVFATVFQAWCDYVRRGPVQDPLEEKFAEWRALPAVQFQDRLRDVLSCGPSSR